MSPDPPVPVHSIQEEHLYILLQRCTCGNGFELVSQTLETRGPQHVDRITGRCLGCAQSRDFHFDVSGFFGHLGRYAALQVNPTPEPSRAIDLEGWTKLALFYLNMIPRAQQGPERVQTTFMAVQCIEEALKLIPPGEERPPVEAFFNSEDPARRESLSGQDTFRGSYLRQLKRPLPPIDVLRDQVGRAVAESDGQTPSPGPKETG